MNAFGMSPFALGLATTLGIAGAVTLTEGCGDAGTQTPMDSAQKTDQPDAAPDGITLPTEVDGSDHHDASTMTDAKPDVVADAKPDAVEGGNDASSPDAFVPDAAQDGSSPSLQEQLYSFSLVYGSDPKSFKLSSGTARLFVDSAQGCLVYSGKFETDDKKSFSLALLSSPIDLCASMATLNLSNDPYSFGGWSMKNNSKGKPANTDYEIVSCVSGGLTCSGAIHKN